MEEESAQFDKERSERVRQLQCRQSRELECFDEESISRGFSLMALTSPPTPLSSVNSVADTNGDSGDLTPSSSLHSFSAGH